MNNKKLALIAVAAGTAYCGVVFLKVLDIVKAWDEAEEARTKHDEFMTKMMAVRETLDRQLETARFWEQVTHDM